MNGFTYFIKLAPKNRESYFNQPKQHSTRMEENPADKEGLGKPFFSFSNDNWFLLYLTWGITIIIIFLHLFFADFSQQLFPLLALSVIVPVIVYFKPHQATIFENGIALVSRHATNTLQWNEIASIQVRRFWGQGLSGLGSPDVMITTTKKKQMFINFDNKNIPETHQKIVDALRLVPAFQEIPSKNEWFIRVRHIFVHK